MTRTTSRVDPTRGSVRTVVRRLAGPAVAATLIQGLFNIVDTFWVGRGLGSAALAGVSTAGFSVWLVLAMAQLPAVGLTAVASRRYGEGRGDLAAAAAYHAFWLGLAVALLLGGLGLAGLPALFELMATPDDVTLQGSRYLGVYLVGAPIVFSYFVMDAAFRAAGDNRTPLLLLGVSLGLNALLDPLLILGIGPFPRLGIQGAALATLVTRATGCAIGYRWLHDRGLLRRARLRSRHLSRMAWIGLPVSAGGAVFSFVYILLTRITSRFGTPALAALGVGHKVESISYMTCIGFGLAAATAVGQNLGSGSPSRAAAAGRVAARYALAITGAAGLSFLLVPEALMRVFTADAAVIAAGASYLRIVAVAQMFMALEIVLQMAMEGAGYSLLPTVASVTLTVLRLPLALALRGVMGLAGIWWTISGTGVARGAAVAWIWHRGTWKERQV
jgi:putative MATE family efflux protein